MKIAKIISTVLHPFVVIPATLFLLVEINNISAEKSILWLLITITLTILPVLIIVLIGRISGKYNDLDISNRLLREDVYRIGIASVFIASIVLMFFDVPIFAKSIQIAGLLSLITSWLINRVTKISVHTLVIAGAATLLILYGNLLPVHIFIIVVCLISVATARIVTKSHSFSQVILGGAVGVFSNLLAYWLFLIL